MSNLDQLIVAVVRFLVLMIPVVAVILLLFAVHVIGGAARRGHRYTESRPSAPVVEQRSDTAEHADAETTSAA